MKLWLNSDRILAEASCNFLPWGFFPKTENEKFFEISIKDKCKAFSRKSSMKQKAVLAFSGGLDTSVVIIYLQEKHDMDVGTRYL